MKPTRDDLRQVHREDACRAAHHPDPLDLMGDRCDCLIRHVTPTEFHEIATAEGYVKLDVEVEQVRAAVTQEGWNDGLRAGVLVPFARQVLAALDGEAT